VVRVGEARTGAYLPFIFCNGMDLQSVRCFGLLNHHPAPWLGTRGRLTNDLMGRLLPLDGPQVAPAQRLINFSLSILPHPGCSAELGIGEVSSGRAFTFQEPIWSRLPHHHQSSARPAPNSDELKGFGVEITWHRAGLTKTAHRTSHRSSWSLKAEALGHGGLHDRRK